MNICTLKLKSNHMIEITKLVAKTHVFLRPILGTKQASYKGAQNSFKHQGYCIALSRANFELLTPFKTSLVYIE